MTTFLSKLTNLESNCEIEFNMLKKFTTSVFYILLFFIYEKFNFLIFFSKSEIF